MGQSYKNQILDHNIEKFSLIVRDDIDKLSSTKRPIQVDKNAILQINSMSDVKKIREELKWHIERNKWVRLRYGWLNCYYGCLAKTIADKTGVPEFIDVLILFIK